MALKPLPAQLNALDVMQDAPVIPVIVLNDVSHAVPMARALVAGGIRMLEVTLRTPVALACMERIAKEVPEAVVGAGTVPRRDKSISVSIFPSPVRSAEWEAKAVPMRAAATRGANAIRRKG